VFTVDTRRDIQLVYNIKLKSSQRS